MQQFKKIKNSFVFIFLFVIFPLNAQVTNDTLFVNQYLQLGPVDFPMVMGEMEDSREGDLKALVAEENIDVTKVWPAGGEEFVWTNAQNYFWVEKKCQENKLYISENQKNTSQISYLGFYIDVKRFVTASISIQSPQMINVYLDGIQLTKKDSYEKADDDGKILPGVICSDLKLETGKHLVMMKCLTAEVMDKEWYVESFLKYDKKYSGSLSVSADPTYFANFKELLDDVKVTDVSLSPDGNIAAVQFSQRDINEDKNESWVELYDTEEGALISTFKGAMDLSNIDWAPRGVMFAYQTSGTKGGSIWIYDLSSGENYELLKDEKDLSGFIWTPDALSIIYTTTTRPEQQDKNFKKFEKIEDRWPYANDVSTIHQVFLPNGVKRDLTSSKVSSYIAAISPDSETLIFARTKYDATKWPFESTNYYTLDLNTLKTDSLFSMIFANGLVYSPDGQNLLVEGAPSSFNGIGKNVSDGTWPNDYDNQAFIYNLKSKTVAPITKNFDPAIDDMYWVKGKNAIYFTTTDKSYKHLYRYNVKTKEFSLVKLEDEYVTKIDFAEDGSKAIFISESSNKPRRVFTLDLENDNVSMLLFPDEAAFSKIKLGVVKDYTFTSKAGQKILGRVYYPPDFNEDKKYPLIVHYYGGTSPIDRNFEGRYPQNIWAANGYVVFTMQPSGSTGFGQKFSAVHVNDWGKVAGEEIIEGAAKFIKEHKFIDAKRVGCIGASYGGFMTMSLLTKTNMFRAGIAHAGISTLTSYWGEGFWGHSYSAVATAKSYPWNRKDIYVDHSPIYSADKINTPLLLLYGNIDTNVPKGESWTMYTALKLLGKDVELIEVDQQGHWIMEYKKRNKWSRTILAYFDKYLKDQPEWWDELYK